MTQRANASAPIRKRPRACVPAEPRGPRPASRDSAGELARAVTNRKPARAQSRHQPLERARPSASGRRRRRGAGRSRRAVARRAWRCDDLVDPGAAPVLAVDSRRATTSVAVARRSTERRASPALTAGGPTSTAAGRAAGGPRPPRRARSRSAPIWRLALPAGQRGEVRVRERVVAELEAVAGAARRTMPGWRTTSLPTTKNVAGRLAP